MADVIGIISGVIGIYQFLGDLFGGHTSQASVVRIAAGLDGATGPSQSGSLTGASGCLWNIAVYNEHHELLGDAQSRWACPLDWCIIGDGGFTDISIRQDNSQQGTYLELVATNNKYMQGCDGGDICIPYVTVTMADGAKYGWVGDWGKECGMEWFYSDIYVDSTKNKPLCAWLNGGEPMPPFNWWDPGYLDGWSPRREILTLHMPDFTTSSPPDNPLTLCQSPSLKYDVQVGNQVPDSAATSTTRRGRAQAAAADTRLVFSSSAEHNATALCLSPTSRGPDFVSRAEGVYCNMETREILPLCSKDVTENCFEASLRVPFKGGGLGVGKNYSRVLEWGA